MFNYHTYQGFATKVPKPRHPKESLKVVLSAPLPNRIRVAVMARRKPRRRTTKRTRKTRKIKRVNLSLRSRPKRSKSRSRWMVDGDMQLGRRQVKCDSNMVCVKQVFSLALTFFKLGFKRYHLVKLDDVPVAAILRSSLLWPRALAFCFKPVQASVCRSFLSNILKMTLLLANFSK